MNATQSYVKWGTHNFVKEFIINVNFWLCIIWQSLIVSCTKKSLWNCHEILYISSRFVCSTMHFLTKLVYFWVREWVPRSKKSYVWMSHQWKIISCFLTDKYQTFPLIRVIWVASLLNPFSSLMTTFGTYCNSSSKISIQ